MTSDSSWLEEVRRWYHAGTQPASPSGASAGDGDTDADLGYEAANPALQSRHWPDAPSSGSADLR